MTALMNASDRRRVLVIDDSEVALEMMKQILEAEDFDVRTTMTLDAFDDLLKDWVPQVVLTDVNMPGMTGVELCRALKSHYETAHVPILLCSSLPHDELAELARQCEADGFICKDESSERLGAEVSAVCDTMSW